MLCRMSSSSTSGEDAAANQALELLKEWRHYFHTYCSPKTPSSLRNRLVKQVLDKQAFNALQVLCDNIRRGKFHLKGEFWGHVYGNRKLIRQLSDPKVPLATKRKLLVSKKNHEVLKAIIIPALEDIFSQSV